MLNVVRMEIVTLVIVCQISLAIHQIADLNAYRTQNVQTIWLALIDTVKILAQIKFAVEMLNVMLLVTQQFVSVRKIMLAIHLFSVQL